MQARDRGLFLLIDTEKWRKSGAIIGFKETTILITARQGGARQMRLVIDGIVLRF
jgi:hypothetical protein